MNVLEYYHGNGTRVDYIDHLNWFVPDLLKNINKLIVNFDVKIFDVKVDYTEWKIDFKVNLRGKITKVQINNIKAIGSLDQLICLLIDSVNKEILKFLDGFIIIAYRPFNDSNLSFTLKDRSYLENLDGFKNIVNNPRKFQLPQNKMEQLYLGLKTFSDLDIKYYSEKFEGCYCLPFFPEDIFKEQTVEVFNTIASLNPNNTVQFEVLDMTTEKATIIFYSQNKRKEFNFGVRDFDNIGHMLNEFQPDNNRKFVLIRPDDDNIMYIFCSRDEFQVLEKYEFIREDYLK